VMMIEPVREGSRLSWSTIRLSGGMRQRIPLFSDARQCWSGRASWFETRGVAALLTTRD
jgi:hypothetical protein